MRTFIWIFLVLISSTVIGQDAKAEIDSMLTKWHQSAANAQFDAYFGLMDEDAVFIGTDPTEHWDCQAFKAFSKPYFDKGKAWSFSKLERHIFLNPQSTTIAWFDELLDTQMGICRGSGVVIKTSSGWKIKHYVLSIAIPNENVKEITALKKVFDTTLIEKLRAEKK